MLQLVADGFVIGSVIALGAIGVTLVYSILQFANFAHGELLTWGAYLAWTVLVGITAVAGPIMPLGPFSFGWSLLASLVVAALATAALALVLDRVLFRRLRRRGSRITPDQLFVLGLTAFTVVALHVFLTRTTLGKAMRATSLNPQLARVTGIDVDRVIRATWIIGGVLAAVAGVFSGLTVQLW